MELNGKRFCMISDKEQLLQTLNLNNVPSVELLDPMTCEYPIIGRRYGHDSGLNFAVISSKEQVLDEGYDYYTKLYAIEKEYYLEIQDLTVKSVQLAVGEQVVYHAIPIRTKAFGWKWKPADLRELQEEWVNTGVRALYVTGLTNGFVKIGVLSSGYIIVIDINLSASSYSEPPYHPVEAFTIGADIEFMLSCDGELLPASTFFPIEGEVGCDARQIEQDSGEYALAEIRPEQTENPLELYENIRTLIGKASDMVPYENIDFRAGSMPFLGYQVGGHIHFGIPLSVALLRVLDYYLAIPIAMIENSSTARRRRRTKHGGLGRFRIKDYGFEYLSLSSWIIDPKLTLSILCLSRLIITHHHELRNDLLFSPLVQRAYYQSNHVFLKQLWPGIKLNLMSTSSYSEYEAELAYLFESIENGYPYSELSDIRKNWGITPESQLYDQGFVIRVPKKTRIKYNLQDGQQALICAGKKIAKATICAYPFTFSYSNTVQLSEALRHSLTIPKEWNPKVTAENGLLILGPIIGILASRPFERQTTYFHHLCRLAAEKQMMVYIFEPQDIDWQLQIIRGTTLQGEGMFPFPAVIYDRLFYDGEKDQNLDEIRAKLQTVYHIPFVNSMSLFQLTGNKWDTHMLLSKEYGDFLPDTRPLEQTKDVITMLDSYGEIYLKPIGGALSRGVIRIIRRPTGIFWMDIKRKKFLQIVTIEDLCSLISSLMNESPYIVQEGIRRKELKEKNLEIRVYMQKSGNQKWFRTGMVARLTTDDVLTVETETNMRVTKVLKQLYPDAAERRSITKQIGDLARNVVKTVENEIGPFGELAVDLCIDQYNSIKIVEINSKPDNLFSQIRAYKLRNIAGIRLLNYAASLAGYLEEKINNE